MKLLKILFVVILLIFPLGEIFRIDFGNDIALRPLDTIVGLTAVSFILISIKNKQFPKTYLNKPLIIFASIGLLSLIVNYPALNLNKFSVSFLYLLRWVSYAVIYFVIKSFDKNFKRLVGILMFIAGLLILITGYMQYFLYPNLRNLYYLGWDEHNYRMYSTFLDPNFLGAFLVLFLLFLIGHKQKEKKHSFKLIFIILFTLVAIFLTYSRSAILMLIVSAGTYFSLTNRKRYIYGIVGLVFVVILLLTPTFNKENTNLFRVTSSLARIETYNNSIKIIKDHPIFGVGFNAYRYAQQSYGFRDIETKYPSHADAGVDNSFLFVLATTGIVGFLAYLNLWRKIIEKNKKSPILIASIWGLFINSFFINSLFFPSIMLWMWILIAVSEDY